MPLSGFRLKEGPLSMFNNPLPKAEFFILEYLYHRQALYESVSDLWLNLFMDNLLSLVKFDRTQVFQQVQV